MKYFFISGIPTSGKTYLAKKVSKMLGVQHFAIDDWRREMRKKPELKKWVDFYWNQDEKKYLETTSCQEQWNNLKKQSEALWPEILKKIKEIQKNGKSAIFEGVNILPHLAHKDLNFNGIILLGESFESVLKRIKKEPRWGKTEKLQIKEAEVFWNCERPNYKNESEKYGFKTFTNLDLAEKELLNFLKK